MLFRLVRASAASVVAAALLVTGPALATQYWTAAGVLKEFFKDSKKVGPRAVALSDADAAAIGKKLGGDAVKKSWSIYVAHGKDGAVDGYAVLDSEKGMHDPIDFAVRFDARGSVQRVEIVEYREAYGDEVRADRFRDQFKGKTAADAIEVGKDIDMISGASISSRSIATGVKRDVLVLKAALASGAL